MGVLGRDLFCSTLVRIFVMFFVRISKVNLIGAPFLFLSLPYLFTTMIKGEDGLR